MGTYVGGHMKEAAFSKVRFLIYALTQSVTKSSMRGSAPIEKLD